MFSINIMTKNKTLLSVVLSAALVSCSDHAGDAAYTVGSEDNAIALTLGMNNSPTASTTRSGLATRADEPSYVALQANTGILMRVEGTWTGHTPADIIKTTNATASAAEGTNTYNTVLSYNPTLYWDDYGTADPANATSGLTQGLAIYAVAVDGQQSAPAVTDAWGSETDDTSLLSWTTIDEQGKAKLESDLLVSNNLSGEDGGDATTPKRLTFAEHKAIRKQTTGYDEKQSRLVFNHVLSKITFKLTANAGFDNYKFTNAPTVELTHSKISDETQTPYCYTTGTVNIKQGKATATTTDGAKLVTLTKASETTTEGGNQLVTEEAIVYPGTVLLSEESDIVARVNADGNIYYVTAKQIKDAIDEALADDANKYQTKAGYNYVFNITVNKTSINVTATVTDWIGVTADEVTPVIAVNAAVGTQGTGTATLGDFSFYRMADEELETENVYNKYNTSFTSGDYYKEEAYAKSSTDGANKTWAFYKSDESTATSLYWPDHQTHYHFRGIYPRTGSASTDKPLVVAYAKTGSSGNNAQGILVSNSKYDANSFPSNLMIGMPEIESGTKCGNKEHTNGKGEVDMSEHGVCARTGNINLNFRYMMSQVVVNLSTTAEAAKVIVNGHTKVVIEGAKKDGYVDLHTRSVGKYNTSEDYQLTNTTNEDNCVTRHDCLVPQDLTGLTFKILVYTEDGQTLRDIYRTKIAEIPVYQANSDGRKADGATAETISAWESGKKYTYNLKLSKSEVKVTATLTDWETKQADTDIWL